jgi:hypothetical protein
MSIDVGAWKTARAGGNAARKRRFSTDAARRGWYAADRARRFGRRFGGVKP